MHAVDTGCLYYYLSCLLAVHLVDTKCQVPRNSLGYSMSDIYLELGLHFLVDFLNIVLAELHISLDPIIVVEARLTSF